MLSVSNTLIWPLFPFMVLAAHSPCTETWLFFIFCIPGASYSSIFFWQLVSGMSGSRANVEGWKPTYILQTGASAPPDVALCCGACTGTQQLLISACPSYGPIPENTAPAQVACAHDHRTVRDPSKCYLIWCLQLLFALAVILGLFRKWIEWKVL